MDEDDLLAERFEDHRTRLRGVAYRMLGLVQRRRRCRAGDLAPAEPCRCERDREPGRVVDDRDRSHLPERAPLPPVAARGAGGRPRTRSRRHPRRPDRSRARGRPRRIRRARPPHRARRTHPAGAGGVRVARHVRGVLRGDRSRRRPFGARHATTGQPGPPAGEGPCGYSRRRSAPPARGGRRVLRRRPRRRSGRAGGGPRPGRPAALGRRTGQGGRDRVRRGCVGGGRPGDHLRDAIGGPAARAGERRRWRGRGDRPGSDLRDGLHGQAAAGSSRSTSSRIPNASRRSTSHSSAEDQRQPSQPTISSATERTGRSLVTSRSGTTASGPAGESATRL